MNENAEIALVQLLAGDAPLAALVSDRISWDDIERDTPYPHVALRTLTTVRATGLDGGHGLRRSLVEISGLDDTNTGASQLMDAVITALDAYEGRNTVAVGSPSVNVVFGGIVLDDVQQSVSQRERSYRRSAFYEVSFYE